MKPIILAHVLVFIISFIPLTSFASFTKGNGGNILVCTNDNNIVLDYYEMKELHGFKFNESLLATNDFFMDIAKNIESFDANLADSFIEQYNRINNSKTFIKTNNLGVIDDVFDIFIPNNCELAQTIIQRNGKLLINQTLFETLSSVQQNILILHEAIYSMLLSKKRLNDSRPVRALVALLVSENFYSMSLQDLKVFFLKQNI